MRQALLAGFVLCLLLTAAAPVASAGVVPEISIQCPTCGICPTTLNDWAFRPVDSAMACLSGDP